LTPHRAPATTSGDDEDFSATAPIATSELLLLLNKTTLCRAAHVRYNRNPELNPTLAEPRGTTPDGTVGTQITIRSTGAAGNVGFQ